jgi:hypothetical protein
MSVPRSRESTIKRHTASMARALAWLNHTSFCTVPGSVFTAISPVAPGVNAATNMQPARRLGNWRVCEFHDVKIRGDGDRTDCRDEAAPAMTFWMAVRAR